MLRKLTIAFITAVIIFVDGSTLSASAAPKTEKYKGPLLKMCRIYQLGEDEFMIRLSGRRLPLPECREEGKTLSIILNDSKAYHPDKINASVLSAMEAIPLLYHFNALNVSDDNSFRVEIEIKANFPMKVHSVSNTVEGISLRVKSDVKPDLAIENIYAPPPKIYPVPQTKVPFSSSEKVTLELRDAPLKDVIRGIMDYAGRNVIIDPSFPKRVFVEEERRTGGDTRVTEVRGETGQVTGGTETEEGNRRVVRSEEDIVVTMTLHDVRVDDALNYIMKTYDLACYNSGPNITTFGSREGLYRLSGERSVKQFKIHFADPAKVRDMLGTIAALDRNAVTVDDRMKAIYVKTNPAKMQEVEDLISILDAPEKQVMIRASVFEFNDNDTLTVQNALDIAYDDIMLSLGSGTGILMTYNNDRSIRQTPRGGTARIITDTFHALEAKAKGKVLANPSVIAMDGKKAEINLTQDYPYISNRDDQKGTVTWSTEEVGPKLSFTPRIGRDGYVNLTLDLSTGDVIDTQTSSTGEQMPVTTTRSVKTEVRVRDGMPFVIGGLFREDNSKNISRIPILGNIPLLGELFTYRYNTKQKTQVVMVITPYILDSN